MKTFRNIVLAATAICCTVSCKETNNDAIFHFFEYQGQDTCFNQSIDPATSYINPIIAGFYPDPSICRKGEDYYMVHSTFSYFPGIPILHSKDLVNWQQIGNVLDRPSQLKLDGIRLSGGIYAPDISYNEKNNTFYVVTTCVDGIGNFVVKTQDPLKGWSDPIILPKVGGIDPALFFDDDGKAYLVHNDVPEGEPEYNGHRAIWIHEYDLLTDATIGTPKVIIDGGVDKSTHPIWIEGPHIYKVNGKYYLMAAEGGTGENHSEVIFIADHVKGPYTPMDHNPILTQRDLPKNRKDKVSSTGHADLIQTHTGEWFAVFLGCRPYAEDMYNTGRETFLLPVSWENETPIILHKGEAVPSVVSPQGWKANSNEIVPDPFNGNFIWKDNFEENELNMRWLFIRTPQSKWWKVNKGLHISPTATPVYAVDSPSFIGYRQQHTNYTVTTEMNFTPQSEDWFAGLVCYQNENNNFTFGKTIREGKVCLLVNCVDNGIVNHESSIELEGIDSMKPLQLRITGRADKISFDYRIDSKWQSVAKELDATILSTQKAGGFTGVVIGMYAVK